MWRNWQTRCVQGAVPERECGFESHHRYQTLLVSFFCLKTTIFSLKQYYLFNYSLTIGTLRLQTITSIFYQRFIHTLKSNITVIIKRIKINQWTSQTCLTKPVARHLPIENIFSYVDQWMNLNKHFWYSGSKII